MALGTLIDKLQKSSFVLGTILVGAANFCIVLILGFTLSNSEFGYFVNAIAFVNLISCISPLRMDLAILKAKNSEVSILLTISIIFSVIFCSILTILCFSINFIELKGVQFNYLLILSILYSFHSILSYTYIRSNKLISLIIYRFSVNIIIIICLTTSYYINPAFLDLKIVIRFYLVANLLWIFLIFGEVSSNQGKFDLNYAKAIITKNGPFIVYSTPALLVSNISNLIIPQLLLSKGMDDTLGILSFYLKLVNSSTQAVATPLNKLYQRAVGKLVSKGRGVRRVTLAAIKNALFIGFVLQLLMLTIAFICKSQRGDVFDVYFFTVVFLTGGILMFISKNITGFAIIGQNRIGLYYQGLHCLILFVGSMSIIALNIEEFIMFLVPFTVSYLAQIAIMTKVTRIW